MQPHVHRPVILDAQGPDEPADMRSENVNPNISDPNSIFEPDSAEENQTLASSVAGDENYHGDDGNEGDDDDDDDDEHDADTAGDDDHDECNSETPYPEYPEFPYPEDAIDDQNMPVSSVERSGMDTDRVEGVGLVRLPRVETIPRSAEPFANDSDTDGSLPGLVSTSEDSEDDDTGAATAPYQPARPVGGSTFDFIAPIALRASMSSSRRQPQQRQLRQAAQTSASKFSRLRLPLLVHFDGEEASGPGVAREFFRVAFKSFLDQLFVSHDDRTFWFGDSDRPQEFFCMGALLGQAILTTTMIPSVFPTVLFELLLQRLNSSCATSTLNLSHLASISPAEADSMRLILDYSADDIGAAFGDIGWERTGELDGGELSQANKDQFVASYIRWSFSRKILHQLLPLSEGFRAVVGGSTMLRDMVDAEQLQLILCGVEAPVDMAALQRRAQHEGWSEDDKSYIDLFWSVLRGLPAAEKLQFVLFLTASDRMPMDGWGQLRLQIMKNGVGDDRLPAAYTCFNLLHLPKYSSGDILRERLLLAICETQGFGLR